MFKPLVIFLTLCLGNAAFLKKDTMIKRHDFIQKSRADGATMHEVIFSIKQNNLDVLEREVLERSTPGTDKYQKWMTFGQVGDLIKNDEGVESVLSYLAKHEEVKVTWIATRREYFRAMAPVSVWEKMFDTEFYNWLDESPHTDTKVHIIRSNEYSLPEEIHDHVHAVFHTVDAPPVIPRKYHRKAGNTEFKTVLKPNLRRVEAALAEAKAQVAAMGLTGEAATPVVTVAYLNAYYGITSNIGLATLNQSVFETSTEYFSQSDLADFQTQYSLTKQAAGDIGGHETTKCSFNTCGEGNLDIQYIMGVSQVTSSYFWYVSGSSSNPFVAWITDLASDPNPPHSNSMSWGSIEQDNSASVLSSFQTEAMKLGAIGVTVTISSGDDGVANSNCACTTNSGSSVSSWTGAGTWSGVGYFPNFPASCPYVTAVGATMGANGYPPAVGTAEIACQSQLGGVITSGGGFSTYYPTPSWQTAAVSSYFSTVSTQPASGFNPNGRGLPDVAFMGVYYQVVIDGQIESVFGTSCSSPVTAAMISLINAARVSQGLSTIGFINPTLYASTNAAKFSDVTSGKNNCCANSSPSAATCCASGFLASAGWDPVTGLGSIPFANFASMFSVTA